MNSASRCLRLALQELGTTNKSELCRGAGTFTSSPQLFPGSARWQGPLPPHLHIGYDLYLCSICLYMLRKDSCSPHHWPPWGRPSPSAPARHPAGGQGSSLPGGQKQPPSTGSCLGGDRQQWKEGSFPSLPFPDASKAIIWSKYICCADPADLRGGCARPRRWLGEG